MWCVSTSDVVLNMRISGDISIRLFSFVRVRMQCRPKRCKFVVGTAKIAFRRQACDLNHTEMTSEEYRVD